MPRRPSPIVPDDLGHAIRDALTPDLLRAPYRAQVESGANAMTGHCYVASEVYYHLAGRAAGFIPTRLRHEGSTHWFLRHPDGRLVDLTCDQFTTPVPHAEGVGGGFLTALPSARARRVLERVAPDWTPVPRPARRGR